MSDRVYTAKLNDRDIKITSRDLTSFREMYIGNSELSERMSELIWFDLYVMDAEFGVSPHDVLSAIKGLEKGELPSGTKPATQFRNMPLKGLWHKHFFSAHFLVQNLLLGLGKRGLEKIVNEVVEPGITQEMLDELAHRVTHEPLESRDADKKLTGEWIIFLKHEGRNYYLCCNTHNAGDQFIFDRILEHCVRDFPQLPDWLKAHQGL